MAALWPLDPGMVFLNHGSFGSCPRWVLEQQRQIVERLEHEPIRFIVEELEALIDRSRARLARFLNADEQGLVFVSNATAGVNTVLRSLRFNPGEELLTNNHEYNACNNALRYVAEGAGGTAGASAGVRVVSVDIPFPIKSRQQVIDAIIGAITPRTRLVLLSHVTSPTGLVFPIREIVSELNRRGVDALIDGAHAPGMLPIDLRAINAPYYTGNCHKWLCAPKGAAFLHVREDRRAAVRPLVISHGANSTRTDRPRLRLEFDYAGTIDFSAWLCVGMAIDYLESLHPRGWPGIFDDNRRDALAGRDELVRQLAGMGDHSPIPPAPAAPDDMIGSLASVLIRPRPPHAGHAPPASKYHDELQDRLLRLHRVQVPIFPFGPSSAPSAQRIVRIACQLYNTREQAAYLGRVLCEELERETRGL